MRTIMSALTVAFLAIALMPMTAIGHEGGSGSTCPGDHFLDNTHTETGDFGSIAMTGTEDSEQLTATINEGYTVEICVKQAHGHEHFTVTSENDGTIWDGDLSHWSYQVTGTPTTTTHPEETTTTVPEATTTTDPGSTTTTVPETTTTTVEDSTTTTVAESTTTTVEDTTTTTEGVLPFTGVDTGPLVLSALALLSLGVAVLRMSKGVDEIEDTL